MVERPDAAAEGRAERRRLEIVHESLLSNWPRLVRWRTQDADGAQLRDDLRQAAKRWEEKGQSDDLLWTGTAFKEFEVWKERYPGGLTEVEEEYWKAMTARAERLKQRRRMAIAVAFAVLLAVLAVVGVSRQQAIDAARRSEASKLLALGQLELESDPATALVYATKSLELADSTEARLFALRALSLGPPVTVLPYEGDIEGIGGHARFSHDSQWLALEGAQDIGLVSRDGETRLLLGSFPGPSGIVISRFTPDGKQLASTKGGLFRIWSVPEFEEILNREIPIPEAVGSLGFWQTEAGYYAYSGTPEEFVITPVSAAGEPGSLKSIIGGFPFPDIDPTGRWFVDFVPGGREVRLRSLDDWEASPQVVGVHAEPIAAVRFHPDGQQVAAIDRVGEVRLWSIGQPNPEPLRTLTGTLPGTLVFDAVGDRLVVWGRSEGAFLAQLWDLRAPVDALAAVILSPGIALGESPFFSPDGKWLTTNHQRGRALWPLTLSRPTVLGGTAGQVIDLAFSSDGRLLLCGANKQAVASQIQAWDLEAEGESRVVGSFQRVVRQLALDPEDRFAVATVGDDVWVVPLDGEEPRRLEGATQFPYPVAVDAAGRRAASASIRGPAEMKVVRIWDLESGKMQTLGPVEGAGEGEAGMQFGLEFLPGGQLVSVGDGGLRLWDIDAGTNEIIAPDAEGPMTVFGRGRYAAYGAGTPETIQLAITDLEERTTRLLPAHGSTIWPVSVDPTGEIVVTGSDDGTIRVGPVSGEEPHLLLGHEGAVLAVAISPDRRWIASGGADEVIRLWPMPDLSKPPLHKLPHEELLAKLHSLTNLHVVEDPESATGWKVEVGPFPGWDTVPAW